MPRPRKWGRKLDEPAATQLKMPGAGLPNDVLRVSLETRDRDLGEKRLAMFRDLYRQGGRMLALLRARQDGRLTTQRLDQAYRAGTAALDALVRECEGQLLAPLVAKWAAAYTKRDRARALERVQRFVTDHGGARATTTALTAEAIATWLGGLTNAQGRRKSQTRRTSRARAVRAGFAPRTAACATCRTTFPVLASGPLPKWCDAHHPKRGATARKPASGATRNRYRGTLSGLCTWLVKHGHLDVHPIAHKRVEKAEEADGRMPAPFTPADYRGYLGAVAAVNVDAHVVASVLLHTAADLGEVLSRLPWQAELDRPQPRIRFRRTKTKTPERTVPIPAPTVTLLRAHLARHQLGAEQPLFGMVSEAAYRRAHRAGRAAINRPSLRIKDLRHVAAIAWAQANVRLDRLRTLLGHSSLSQTMIYITYMPDTAEESEIAAASLRQLAGAPSVAPSSPSSTATPASASTTTGTAAPQETTA